MARHIPPCCGIYSGAVFGRLDAHELWDAYKRKYHKTGNWGGRVHVSNLLTVLKELGVDTKPIHTDRSSLKQFCWHEAHRDAKPRLLLVRTSSHLQAVVGDNVCDQVTERFVPIGEFWGKGKRVTDAWMAL